MTCNIDKGVLQSVVDNIRNTPHHLMKKRLDKAEYSTLATNINDIMEKTKMAIKIDNTITVYDTDNKHMIMKHNNDFSDCPGYKNVYIECSDDSQCAVIPHDDIPAVAAWLLSFHKITSTTDKV